jgi:hypothetical protein
MSKAKTGIIKRRNDVTDLLNKVLESVLRIRDPVPF